MNISLFTSGINNMTMFHVEHSRSDQDGGHSKLISMFHVEHLIMSRLLCNFAFYSN
jgi:hypothetical protein